jgi:hypothetical protein
VTKNSLNIQSKVEKHGNTSRNRCLLPQNTKKAPHSTLKKHEHALRLPLLSWREVVKVLVKACIKEGAKMKPMSENLNLTVHINYNGDSMSEAQTVIEKIYQEVVTIREKLETIERMIIPEEEVSEEELNEIRSLKSESLRGEVVPWSEVKKKVEELIK